MTNRSHIHAFDWCQNQRPWMTLKGHYALCFKTRASFGAHHENLNEDRLYSQRWRCSPMTLDSDDIRCMWMLAGFPWKGASSNSVVIKNVFFRGFGRYVFGTLGNEVNIIIIYYLAPFVAFPLTPKYVTLNDFEWPFYVIVHYYELPLIHYLLLIYCRLFFAHDMTSGEVREAQYNKQWSAERQNIWKICWSIFHGRYRRNLNK